jgi:hypothetical protein
MKRSIRNISFVSHITRERRKADLTLSSSKMRFWAQERKRMHLKVRQCGMPVR